MVVELETVAVIDETETLAEVVSEHPFTSVTVTVYVELEVGEIIIELVVAPLLHE